MHRQYFCIYCPSSCWYQASQRGSSEWSQSSSLRDFIHRCPDLKYLCLAHSQAVYSYSTGDFPDMVFGDDENNFMSFRSMDNFIYQIRRLPDLGENNHFGGGEEEDLNDMEEVDAESDNDGNDSSQVLPLEGHSMLPHWWTIGNPPDYLWLIRNMILSYGVILLATFG